MASYALYARQKWDVKPDGVVGGLVYLAQEEGRPAERTSVAADEATLEACRTLMRGSIAEMRAALVDREKNVARLEDFPQTEDRERCARCAFRRPCGRL